MTSRNSGTPNTDWSIVVHFVDVQAIRFFFLRKRQNVNPQCEDLHKQFSDNVHDMRKEKFLFKN